MPGSGSSTNHLTRTCSRPELPAFICSLARSFSFVESGCQHHSFVHGIRESLGGGHGLDYSGGVYVTSRLPSIVRWLYNSVFWVTARGIWFVAQLHASLPVELVFRHPAFILAA